MCCRSGCTGRSTRPRCLPRCPRPSQRVAVLDRTKEPGSLGEPLFLDVLAALREAARRRRAREHAARDRRPLRPLLEGVHPGDGRRRVRRARARAAAKRRFTVGITDDVSAPASPTTGRSTSSRPRPSGRSSSASDPTARSARTRTRSRSSATSRPPRPGLLRLRLEEVGLADRFAPALRPRTDQRAVPHRSRPASSAATSSALLERAEVLDGAPGATLLLNCRLRCRTSLGRACASWSRSRSSPSSSNVYVIDAGAIAREAGLADASTRCCRRASSRSPACWSARRRSSAIKDVDRARPTASGAEVVERNSRAVDQTLGGPPPRSSSRHSRDARARAAGSCRRPGFRARTVTAAMIAGRGDELPVSALPIDGTYPSGTTAVREAQHRRAGRRLGPESVHPVRQLQLRLSAQRDPLAALRADRACGRAGGLRIGAARRAGLPGHALHAAGPTSEDCTGCGAVRGGLSGLDARTSPSRKAINLDAREPLRRGERAEHRLLRVAARPRPLARRLRHRSRHPVPGAAVRVLRRLRGMRRDAVSSSCSRSCSATG